LWVDPTARREAPPAVVACEVAVNKEFHEEPLAEAPIKKEVFGEEGGGDHAAAVVHVCHVGKLTHCGVNDRVAGTALAPSGKVLAAIFPFDVGVFRFKRLVHAVDKIGLVK